MAAVDADCRLGPDSSLPQMARIEPMKAKLLLLIFVLATVSLGGQGQLQSIVLTSRDVDTNSVRLISRTTESNQNVVFRYLGKSSAEIKAIRDNHPTVRIVRNGAIVAETDPGACSGYVEHETNYVGLVLGFSQYDKAMAAAKALRGN